EGALDRLYLRARTESARGQVRGVERDLVDRLHVVTRRVYVRRVVGDGLHALHRGGEAADADIEDLREAAHVISPRRDHAALRRVPHAAWHAVATRPQQIRAQQIEPRVGVAPRRAGFA